MADSDSDFDEDLIVERRRYLHRLETEILTNFCGTNEFSVMIELSREGKILSLNISGEPAQLISKISERLNRLSFEPVSPVLDCPFKAQFKLRTQEETLGDDYNDGDFKTLRRAHLRNQKELLELCLKPEELEHRHNRYKDNTAPWDLTLSEIEEKLAQTRNMKKSEIHALFVDVPNLQERVHWAKVEETRADIDSKLKDWLLRFKRELEYLTADIYKLDLDTSIPLRIVVSRERFEVPKLSVNDVYYFEKRVQLQEKLEEIFAVLEETKLKDDLPCDTEVKFGLRLFAPLQFGGVKTEIEGCSWKLLADEFRVTGQVRLPLHQSS